MKYNKLLTIILPALLPLLICCAATKATKQKGYNQETISNVILKFKKDIYNDYSHPNTIRSANFDKNGYSPYYGNCNMVEVKPILNADFRMWN